MVQKLSYSKKLLKKSKNGKVKTAKMINLLSKRVILFDYK